MMKLLPSLIKYMSKRRRMRALCIALIDHKQWGPPRRTGPTKVATQQGWCPACSTVISVGDVIDLAHRGPLDAPMVEWVHRTCPDDWDILRDLIEEYDELVVTAVFPEGQRDATCGHRVAGSPVYRVRRLVSLLSDNHSYYLCKDCVKR